MYSAESVNDIVVGEVRVFLATGSVGWDDMSGFNPNTPGLTRTNREPVAFCLISTDNFALIVDAGVFPVDDHKPPFRSR